MTSIRWAPLHLPMRRRLQTAVVVLMIIALPVMLSTYAYLLLSAPLLLRTATAAYTAFIWFWDSSPVTGGRISPWLRRWRVWRVFGDYFPCNLHVEQKLDPSKKYILGLHPHGIIGMSFWSTLFTEAREASRLLDIDYRVATVTASFKIPFWRDLVLACGGISASRHSVNHCLQSGKSVVIVVGGALEALDARPGSVDLTLRRRRGFVRLALQSGADLVPVYSFGENELYEQFGDSSGRSRFRRLQQWLIRHLGFCLPIVKGRGVFQYSIGLLPFRIECHTVVGKPIPLPQVDDPSEELVERHHKQYCDALAALFDRYKGQYAPPKLRQCRLRIVR